jgi:hypothetical protein
MYRQNSNKAIDYDSRRAAAEFVYTDSCIDFLLLSLLSSPILLLECCLPVKLSLLARL